MPKACSLLPGGLRSLPPKYVLQLRSKHPIVNRRQTSRSQKSALSPYWRNPVTIDLAPIDLPDFGPLGEQPTVPAATYAARADRLHAEAGTDWVMVYADREHFG